LQTFGAQKKIHQIATTAKHETRDFDVHDEQQKLAEQVIKMS
jgi:hypothetical protein